MWAPRRSLVCIVRASSLLLSCILRCFGTSAKLLIERLLTNTLGLVALLIAVVIHTVDVAMSVFGLKLQSHRDTMNVLSLCHLSERSESHA